MKGGVYIVVSGKRANEAKMIFSRVGIMMNLHKFKTAAPMKDVADDTLQLTVARLYTRNIVWW